MPDFRQQIRDFYKSQQLSEAKADAILSATQPAAEGAKVVEFPRARIIRRVALAAALLLCAALAFQFGVRRPQQVSFAVVVPRIVEFFQTPPKLKESQDKAELRAWLLANGSPADFAVPAKLAALQSVGCSVVDVKGKPAYLTCFWREPGPGATDRELIHLFAVRRSDFRDAPSGPAPQLREMAGWSFASWSAGEVIYTMATPAPLEKLRPFLAGEPRPLPGVIKLVHNAKGVESSSPARRRRGIGRLADGRDVARHELPWERNRDETNPNGVVAGAVQRHNPVGVGGAFRSVPRVVAHASLQPWAEGRNAVGVALFHNSPSTVLHHF